MICGGVDVITVEIKCTINVIHLNHLETILPTMSVEKLSSTKPVPGAKKGWDCWSSILRYFTGEFAESTPEYLEFVVDVIHLCDTRLFLVKISHYNLKTKWRHLYSLSPLHYKSHPLLFFGVISSWPTSDERTVCFPGNMICQRMDGDQKIDFGLLVCAPINMMLILPHCSNPSKGLNLGGDAMVVVLVLKYW